MQAWTVIDLHGQVEHLVKVTVVQVALPVYADKRSAHDRGGIVIMV